MKTIIVLALASLISLGSVSAPLAQGNGGEEVAAVHPPAAGEAAVAVVAAATASKLRRSSLKSRRLEN